MATLRNSRTGKWLATELELATNLWQKTKGLLGRDQLPQGQGLYLDHCQSIHSFFMRFPFDALFVDVQWRVLLAAEEVAPNRIGPVLWRARGVVELPAGVIAASETRVGDHLEFRNA